MNGRIVLAVLSAITFAMGCADRPTDPVPTVPPIAPPPPPAPGAPAAVVVSLTQSPHSDDGALVVTMRGPMHQDNINTFKPFADYFLFIRGPSQTEMRVSLVGSLTTGPLFRFYLAPGAQLSDYTATVSQVATVNDSLRTDLGAYRITLTTP